ncbi:MAG: hypothetical protein KAR54_00515 [Candidatus Pacebacteria bacterium]|nr:hypothetical protein [Candidatus Paceibacterota bacterium]
MTWFDWEFCQHGIVSDDKSGLLLIVSIDGYELIRSTPVDRIEFKANGCDKRLWLIRNTEVILIAECVKNKIRVSDLSKYPLEIKDNIVKITSKTKWIKLEDGFEISSYKDGAPLFSHTRRLKGRFLPTICRDD